MKEEYSRAQSKLRRSVSGCLIALLAFALALATGGCVDILIAKTYDYRNMYTSDAPDTVFDACAKEARTRLTLMTGAPAFESCLTKQGYTAVLKPRAK